MNLHPHSSFDVNNPLSMALGAENPKILRKHSKVNFEAGGVEKGENNVIVQNKKGSGLFAPGAYSRGYRGGMSVRKLLTPIAGEGSKPANQMTASDFTPNWSSFFDDVRRQDAENRRIWSGGAGWYAKSNDPVQQRKYIEGWKAQTGQGLYPAGAYSRGGCIKGIRQAEEALKFSK